MKLVSFVASGRNSYGAVVGDGVFDLGRRLGDRYPTLRAAIAGDAVSGATAVEVRSGAPDIALSQVTLAAAEIETIWGTTMLHPSPGRGLASRPRAARGARSYPADDR